MKIFCRMLLLDLRRALSWRFFTAVLASLTILMIGCSGVLADGQDVLYLLSMSMGGTGGLPIILGILSILPYGISFALDAEDRAAPFWLIRAGATKYTLSKMLAAAISAFLMVVLTIGVFVAVYSVFFPLFVAPSSGDPYSVLLDQGRVFSFLLFLSAHYGLSAALFCCIALTLSVYIPDKFVVLTAPYVLYLFVLRIATFLPLPDVIKPANLMDAIYPGGTPAATLLYKLVPVVVLAGILANRAISQMKHRMNRT